MAKIFGRKIDETHPLRGRWPLPPVSLEHWVMSSNIKIDERVSPEREKVFVQYAVEDEEKNVINILKDYHNGRIKYSRSPDFLDVSINNENILFDRFHQKDDFFVLDRDMVSFLSLNRLNLVFEWRFQVGDVASAEGLRPLGPPLDRFWPEHPFADEDEAPLKEGGGFADREKLFADRLDALLADETRWERFVDGMCRMLNDHHRIVGPHYPKWATTWDEYERVRDAAKTFAKNLPCPEPIAPEMLGVPVRKGDWVIGFRYSAREVPNIVRPTQLDAGAFPQHYPSPPDWNRDVTRGGAAMNVAPGGASCYRPPSEYIHAHIPLSVDHWLRGGPILIQAERDTPQELMIHRACHRAALSP